MELGNLKKITAAKAALLVAGSPLEGALLPLLADDPDPTTVLTRLVDDDRALDAARFVLLALPARELIWLACLAARLVAETAPLSASDLGALEAAEKWVYAPNEDTRRAAEKSLEGSTYATPAALAALATFYSGGNIATPGLPELAAPPGVCVRLVEAAQALAAIDEDEPRMRARARRLLAQALDVAGGGSGRDPKV